MLTLQALVASYHDAPLFQPLDLHVERGEVIAVVGRSGCGKSTLLQLLAGLKTPDQGQILLDGREIAGQAGHASLLPQGYPLLPWLSLLDNIILPLTLSGHTQASAAALAEPHLARFGLEHAKPLLPHQASGGMQQRAALLRTFLHPTELMLLDEPFSALDAITRSELHTWLLTVLPQFSKTVFLVTHDIDEALLFADRLLVFVRGSIQVIERKATEKSAILTMV
ncbi:MAG: ATP-binding cassette domain-containing protein [Gammaproteobacteria bacterium]|nr:ATP-binding cassette domain-containing protein [Gammaproteobacteria bacterium]